VGAGDAWKGWTEWTGRRVHRVHSVHQVHLSRDRGERGAGAVATALLDRQFAAQADAFEQEGGFTERLYRTRTQRRRGA